MQTGTGRPKHHDEAGMTLIEVMVAILVLGLILSGLATVIIGSLRAIVQNERQVYATSLAQEAIEELQAVDWLAAGLYTDEVTSASAAWAAQVSSDRQRYDGDLLVQLPNPPSAAERLTQVPPPTSQYQRANVEYTVHRYVTWVDRDSDDTTETKRFSVYVRWTDRQGTQRELRSVGERIPAQSEAAATSAGTRVLAFTASPDPAPINLEGRSSANIRVTVRTNRPLKASPKPVLRFSTLDSADGQPDVFSEKERNFEVVEGTNRTVWTTNIPPTDNFRWPEGASDLRMIAVDDQDHEVTAAGSVYFSTSLGSFPTVNDVSPSPVCVDPSTLMLREDVTVTVNVSGLEEDEAVSVGFLTGGPDPQWITQSAEFQYGISTNSYFKATLAASLYQFDPGSTVTFRATATRSGEGDVPGESSTPVDSIGVTVSTSCA